MFLSLKNIPKVSWSSKKPLNFKPKISTFFFLCFGLTLFGLGEGLLLVSSTGASPWSVLAQGISLNVNYSIGIITFFKKLNSLYELPIVGDIRGKGLTRRVDIIAARQKSWHIKSNNHAQIYQLT